MKMNNRKMAMNFISVSTITILFAIIFILSVQNVSAQERYGCCYKQIDGKYCEEGYETISCDAANFLGGSCTDSRNSDKCGLVTCATSQGCMANVKKGKCLYEYKGTVAVGDECSKGCCGIADRSYGIIEKKVCKAKAFEKGFNESYIEFLIDIQDEHQCAAHFEPTVKGCCIAEGCKDTTRAECQSDFRAGILCKQIPTICQVQEIGLRCGKQNNQEKVVLLDSAGGEEVQYRCALPQYRCMECGSETCDFDKTINPGRTTVKQFEGYCVDTTCKLEGIGKQQAIDANGKIKAVEAKSKILQTGQSICFNFYGVASGGNAKDVTEEKAEKYWDAKKITDITHMLGRSTGLQNQVLVCNYGDIAVVGLGDDRKLLCADDPKVYVAIKFKNIEKVGDCIDCGYFSPAFINPIGDYISAGWMFGPLLGAAISEQCDKNKCASVKSAEGEELCYYSKDTFGQTSGFKLFPAVGSCVPKFPLGESAACGVCGGGGDWWWNICKEEECYSLGNCQFKPANPFLKSIFFATSLTGFLGTNRLAGAPVEALAEVTDLCLKCGAIPGCCLAAYAMYPAVLGETITESIAFQITPAFKGVLTFTKGVLNIGGQILNAVGNIKSLIGK